MATSESKGRFFTKRIDSHNESNRFDSRIGMLYYKPEAVLALRVTRGHYRWRHSTGDNISYFHFQRPYAYLASFWSYGEKNKIATKNENWLPWQRPLGLKIRKSRFRSFIYSIAEPNGENRVNIRRAEVEIIGLTEIAKKEKIWNTSKRYGISSNYRYRVAK